VSVLTNKLLIFFVETGSDGFMEIEKHNLPILLKYLVATAILYTWTKNAYAMQARLKRR